MGRALRVSRYLPERRVRLSVWDETGTARAAVSIDEDEAGRLATFPLPHRDGGRACSTACGRACGAHGCTALRVRTVVLSLASALLAASVLATVYGAWLVTTDVEGGRLAVGTMVLVVAVPLLALSAYALGRL